MPWHQEHSFFVSTITSEEREEPSFKNIITQDLIYSIIAFSKKLLKNSNELFVRYIYVFTYSHSNISISWKTYLQMTLHWIFLYLYFCRRYLWLDPLWPTWGSPQALSAMDKILTIISDINVEQSPQWIIIEYERRYYTSMYMYIHISRTYLFINLY